MSENQEIKEDFEEEYRKCECCGAYIPAEYTLCGDCVDKMFPPPNDEIDENIPEPYPGFNENDDGDCGYSEYLNSLKKIHDEEIDSGDDEGIIPDEKDDVEII